MLYTRKRGGVFCTLFSNTRSDMSRHISNNGAFRWDMCSSGNPIKNISRTLTDIWKYKVRHTVVPTGKMSWDLKKDTNQINLFAKVALTYSLIVSPLVELLSRTGYFSWQNPAHHYHLWKFKSPFKIFEHWNEYDEKGFNRVEGSRYLWSDDMIDRTEVRENWEASDEL